MPPPLKILILHASIGEGHRSAANAVESALYEQAPEADIRNMDALALTSGFFAKAYRGTYLSMIDRAPKLLGLGYDLLDRLGNGSRNWGDRIKLAIESSQTRGLQDFLLSRYWDLIVTTHFLPAGILASLIERGRLASRHYCVTTDLMTHRIWVNNPCDRYFVATEGARSHLLRLGIPSPKITVSGIPVRNAFQLPLEKTQAVEMLGLDPAKPVILQLAGGIGTGPMDRVYSELMQVKIPLQIVAVAGRNSKAKMELEKISIPSRHSANVLGFTDQMRAWMAAADLIVTKPGGLTVSEALACARPMVLVNPVPGQEMRNAEYLSEAGAAVSIADTTRLAETVADLFSRPEKLYEMKDCAARLARPDAARTIAREILAGQAVKSEAKGVE